MSLLSKIIKKKGAIAKLEEERLLRQKARNKCSDYMDNLTEAIDNIKEFDALRDGPEINFHPAHNIKATLQPISDIGTIVIIFDKEGGPLYAYVEDEEQIND